MGEELLGPTLIAFGTPEQQRRFLPPIRAVRELWCQGYSEPGAGSDLASVATRAALRRRSEWVITGQKVWTSLAHVADWCFVLARTEAGSRRGAGLSYLLVPMRQPGVTVRPIRQLTGTAEFNEVFFDGARTAAANVVGAPGDGWRIAKATLAIERGAAMLGQQIGFRRELDDLVQAARHTEAGADPLLRDKLARAWIGLEVIRAYALDTLGGGRPGRGVGAEGAVVPLAPRSRRAGHGRARRPLGGAAGASPTTWTTGSGSSCSAGPTRSTAGPTRSSGTSSPAARSACPESVMNAAPARHGLLDGKVVVVTAAAGTGIGGAAARRCLEEGARVAISDQHERRLAATRDELAQGHGDRVWAQPCDVTDEAQVAALIEGAAGHFGRIDVMINNAGLGGTRSVLEMTDEQWLRVLDVTLTGTFRCTRAALRQMVAQGHGGAVVNNASVLGWRAQPGQAHYAAAKAGVMALTRCAALDVAAHGIRVNAVAPSLAVHPFLAKVTGEDLLAELAAREPFGRAAEPWEVANVMVFLASDYAGYMTGEVVSVSAQHP